MKTFGVLNISFFNVSKFFKNNFHVQSFKLNWLQTSCVKYIISGVYMCIYHFAWATSKPQAVVYQIYTTVALYGRYNALMRLIYS